MWKQALNGLVTLASPEALEALKSERARQFKRERDAEAFRSWIEEAIGQVEAEIKRSVIDSMSNFEILYNRNIENVSFHTNEEVSDELRPLMQSFYSEMISRPVNISALKATVIDILSFLCTPEGRTNANCRAVDLFICINNDWDAVRSQIPEELRAIISDMGMCLHDTFNAPEIAKEFDSTPEQLLARAKALQV